MAHRTIHNTGDPLQMEYTSHEALTPGMLVTLNSDGEVAKHTVSEVQTEVMIVEENALHGGSVSTAWTSGDQVSVLLPKKGELINVLVESGQNIAIGDYLVSGGNGLFIEPEAATSGSLSGGVLVKAVEAAGALTANTLVAVRVL